MNGICTVILWQDWYGNGNSKKFYFKYGWEKVPNWECLFVNREKGYSYLCMWTISNWLERNKTLIRCGKYSKKVDLGEPTSFLDHVYLGCTQRNVRLARILWIIIEVCSNQGFLPWLQKNCQKHKPRRNLMPKRYLHGPVTWKVTQRNAWKDIANLRIKQLNNYTKSRHHVWMTSIFKKKKLDELENCQKFPRKSS